MPAEASNDALLLGAGAAFRYRYARPFAIEFGGSGVFGHDYVGVPRREWALDLSQLFLGSGEPGLAPFALVGLNLTLAHREEAPRDPVMLGAHMGFGASAGLHENVRLTLELDLNWRTRVDADPAPEYRDPSTGATSDSTMAIVLRAGASFDLR